MPKKQAKSFDVIVIGAGPAGYSSAIRCAQLGLKTACIDNWHGEKGWNDHLGGTYLNAGCVATIALLESAKIYQTITHNLKEHGIQAEAVSVDIARMMQRKNTIIDSLSRQIADAFAHNKIDCIRAKAKLLNERQVEIVPADHSPAAIIEAQHIILATGSSPIGLSCAPIDNELIIDSTMALNLDAVPKRLAIIGAGIIGLELASIWNRLGAETILLEAQESFLSMADQQIAREAYRIYSNQGLELRLGTRVISTKKGSKKAGLERSRKVTVEYQDSEGTHALRVDKLIVASGRKPNTENLAAPEADLLLDENGYVHVDENCRSTLPGVYAIGDLTLLGPMIAHKGIEEGRFVAEQIAGRHSSVNYELLPSVVFTDPEIAWVGQTEQALRAMGEPIKIGTFPLRATARAQATGRTEGIVKIIAHADTDAILGVHIIGTQASEMIAEAVLAMEFSASSEDLARTVHVHPTLAKAMNSAALAFRNGLPAGV
ncbi:dihydrolipoyl dehydrogenase [Candidatus Methylobacter oryzae]|uniref:Dihydrolipoyl dehydrogenase n=1 Tax=Candidatus Methylobacter oryzae TaxID=2497749 RepID=A0ABY3CBQ8_9GAMM|nr:dihydrolipoyl dehydrogenase [Candidatus Methylobacter oryzae]TRW96130.1 dihydrolipoyl dehydrogenase [Candidatus Methylobacter oryzae]